MLQPPDASPRSSCDLSVTHESKSTDFTHFAVVKKMKVKSAIQAREVKCWGVEIPPTTSLDPSIYLQDSSSDWMTDEIRSQFVMP
eukprot:682909-Hanusia_phi.AAC.1